jgi:hypothetical protein
MVSDGGSAKLQKLVCDAESAEPRIETIRGVCE